MSWASDAGDWLMEAVGVGGEYLIKKEQAKQQAAAARAAAEAAQARAQAEGEANAAAMWLEAMRTERAETQASTGSVGQQQMVRYAVYGFLAIMAFGLFLRQTKEA